MQIYNAADATCKTTTYRMTKGELSQLAQSNQTAILFMVLDEFTEQARLGFSNPTEDTCGCTISL